MSQWIRTFHRWTSIAFVATVIANFVQIAQGGGYPPNWITYSPLLPLALLVLSGMYLFVLPYAVRRRAARGGRSRPNAVGNAGEAVASAAPAPTSSQ